MRFNYLTFGRELLSVISNPVTCAILAPLVASIFRRDPERRRDDFLTTVGFAAFCGIALQLQWLIVKLTPTTIDAQLLRIDHSLGIDPTGFAMWIYGQHPHLFTVFLGVYNMLAPVMAISWIIERNHTMRRALLIGAISAGSFTRSFPQ